MAQHILVGDEEATFNEVVVEIFKSPTVATLCNDWTHFAMKLDHPYFEVQQMRHALTVGTKSHNDIIQELLIKWKGRNTTKATLECLCACFRTLGMNDIADRLLLAFVRNLNTEPAVKKQTERLRRQISYTEKFTPKDAFYRVYLHLFTNVLTFNSKELFEAIVGEAIIQLGLEQLDSVQDTNISLKQRWTNLRGLIESRQAFYSDSYEKFVNVLLNMDHLRLKSFSEGIYSYVQEIKAQKDLDKNL